jgi:hypothetical protein
MYNKLCGVYKVLYYAGEESFVLQMQFCMRVCNCWYPVQVMSPKCVMECKMCCNSYLTWTSVMRTDYYVQELSVVVGIMRLVLPSVMCPVRRQLECWEVTSTLYISTKFSVNIWARNLTGPHLIANCLCGIRYTDFLERTPPLVLEDVPLNV